MKSKLKKLSLLYLILIATFVFVSQAQAQKSKKLTNIDKREIIKVLLAENFKNEANKTIKISRQNLPVAVQSNFPRIVNLNVQLVAESSLDQTVCPFQFKFYQSNREKYVSVFFGDCREGLTYNLKKIRGKWKNVSYVIKR